MPREKTQPSLFIVPERPDFAHERAAGGVVAGVDEVGRGPWAGPVIAAAAILDPRAIPDGIDDSKRLSRRRREALALEIEAVAKIGIGEASVEEVDRLNILRASLLAMWRAIDALPVVPGLALIDGNRLPADLPCAAKALVKGDRISVSIAAASIVAKVARDKIMADLAQDYPAYGWQRNAGYGTREHREALDLVGISPFHRKSFAPIRKLMTQRITITN